MNHPRRAIAMLLALLALASMVGVAASLLASASATLKTAAAADASIRAERIALDLEPLLLGWARKHESTVSDGEHMPSGWFTIHASDIDGVRVRILALDLSGRVSLHPETRGRTRTLPAWLTDAVDEDNAGDDAVLEAVVNQTQLPEGATLYPPRIGRPTGGAVASGFVMHVNTGGWNVRTAPSELLTAAGITRPDRNTRARDTKSGDVTLVDRSNAFAFLIDVDQRALSVRTWVLVQRPADARNPGAAWSITERRRLP